MASDYELLPIGTPVDRLLGSLLEFQQESQGWLEAQPPTLEWPAIMEMMTPTDPKKDLKGLSNTGYDLVSRNARDIVASLANFRHEGEVKPRWNKDLYDAAHILTKLDRTWAVENKVYETNRANLQNAVGFGTGYLVQDWDKRKSDIRLRAFGPDDVTFVQLPMDHDIQQAYMVLIREELPINLAKRTYKNIASRLEPDRDSPSGNLIQRGLRKVQQLMGGSAALRVAGNQRRPSQGSYPTVDIYHAYTLDASINLNPTPQEMGAYGTNWSYTVPAIGDPIPIGLTNPATGAPFTRSAEEDDCRLFPLRRYSIFSRTAVAYDGSSPWWHGEAPVARVRFNDWAWQALGRSLMGEPRAMQEGLIALMRLIEDGAAARLNPAMLYDDQLVGADFAKAFNPRMAGARAAVTLSMGDVVKFPVDVRTYDTPQGIYDWIKAQEQRINHQMGTPDLVAMAKTKQVPGEGTLEKLMEMAGPLVDDMVRAQEDALQCLGTQRIALRFQFMTKGRLVQEVGPEGAYMLDDKDQIKEFEYSYDSLVPMQPGQTAEQRWQQARRLIAEFKYIITESSINERHRLINKLALLQLKKAGVDIDKWTIAKAWRIPNYGPEPEGTNNVLERVRAEKVMALEEQIELQEEMQKAGIQAPGGGGGGQRGRPPTNSRPAQLKQKDGNTRSTISTSG